MHGRVSGVVLCVARSPNGFGFFKALLNSRCDLKRAGRPERALDAGIQMSSAGQQRLEMLRSFYRILAGHLRTSCCEVWSEKRSQFGLLTFLIRTWFGRDHSMVGG